MKGAQNYSDFVRLGTLYVFFHLLEKGNEAYPLYFIEAEFRISNTEVALSFPRDLMLLNTPAINYFKFASVLTIPRATSIASLDVLIIDDWGLEPLNAATRNDLMEIMDDRYEQSATVIISHNYRLINGMKQLVTIPWPMPF